MKFRNQFLKYKLNFHRSPDDDGGGGGDGNDGGENNGENNLISDGSMWEDTPSEEQNSNANQQQQFQQQQQQPASADEQFNTHVASLDFTAGIDFGAAMTAFQQGDAEGAQKAFQQMGANAYRQSLIDANKVVNQRVDAMGNQVKSDVQTSNATSRVVSNMNEAIPFTKEKAYAPMAKVVLTRFLSKGLNPEKAIEQVGKYFDELSGEVAKLKPNVPNPRPSGGFANSGRAGEDGEGDEEPDWQKILMG